MNKSREQKTDAGKPEWLMAEAEHYCSAQGTQLTSLRRLVLETLIKARGPVKAYDLLEVLRELGHRLTPSTVYRILDFFLRGGLVHKVNALNAYVACRCEPQAHRHGPVILVCPDCRTTTEINDRHLNESIFERLGVLGFKIKTVSVEVRGVCPKCAKV
ncbi:MAG: transcriptional repressor [Deltaproteobacteria bacterium]|jgi:Fur family zinc uptake transcriptional regulator|nr:transcriptional repressor [Deltaproteobacteria bacterium]